VAWCVLQLAPPRARNIFFTNKLYYCVNLCGFIIAFCVCANSNLYFSSCIGNTLLCSIDVIINNFSFHLWRLDTEKTWQETKIGGGGGRGEGADPVEFQ
jgi:hypothetical protein